MNPLIVIPTYVSTRLKPRAATPVSTLDHLTPLHKEGELGRCLDSLRKVRGLGQIAVIVSGERTAAGQAVQKVRAICEDFPDLSIMVIGQPEAALVTQRLEQLGLPDLDEQVGLFGYSAVRNMGLLAANVFGFDSVVFIDDDEVVDDPDFLVKGVYGLGKLTRRGIPILAKTGYFLNSEGTYHSKSQSKWYNHFWLQGEAFNKWIDRAMQGPRLSRSNHVCGGCLAIHREAYRRVCFDPWIVRGEDLDYMLDLRMYGSDIWFDNKWKLVHLPPATHSEGLRFRQDIYRWIYEYRKIEYSRTQIDLQQVRPDSLEPYPGPFLEPGITKRIKRTALLRSIGRPDKSAYRKAARAATRDASVYAKRNCQKYFGFQFTWPEVMTRTEGDDMLRTVLLSAVVGAGDAVRSDAASVDPGATGDIRLHMAESE